MKRYLNRKLAWQVTSWLLLLALIVAPASAAPTRGVVLIPDASASALSADGGFPTWPSNPDWQSYVPGPSSDDVKPVAITRFHGNVTNPEALLGGGGVATLTMAPGGQSAVIVLDYGQEVGGTPYINVASTSGSNSVRISTSEALPYLNSNNTTSLARAAAAGQTNVKVASVAPFYAGTTLTIDSGTAAEIRIVTDVGTAVGTAGTTRVATAIGATNVKVSSVSGYAVGQDLLIDSGANAEQATVSNVGTASASTTIPSNSTTLAVASTTLSAATAAGISTVRVANNSGFTAGMTIGIDTGANAETATVASTQTTGLPVPVYTVTPNPPVANWIWSTATGTSSAIGPAYLRKNFTVANPALVTSAPLRINSDDSAWVYVNGTALGQTNISGSNAWRTSMLVDIASMLVPGNNVIALQVINPSSSGSAIGALEIYTAGDMTRYVTDTSWKALAGNPASGPAGWTTQSFDDSAWGNAFISTAYGGSPWNSTVTAIPSTSNYYITFAAPLANAHATSTILGSVTPAGVTNLKVASVSGFSAGQQLTIDTGTSQELATIDTVGTAGVGGTGVTLTSPTTNAHIGAVLVDAIVAPAGATTVKVASVTGFAVGDTITVDTGAAQESVTITAVGTAGASGTGITFTPALAQLHPGGTTVANLGTGVTVSTPFTLAHAAGVSISGLGSGITFDAPLTAAHAAGTTVRGVGTYVNDNGSQINFTVNGAQTYTGGLRGGFRYAAIELRSAGTVTLSGAGLNFRAYRASPDKYQGWFISSDDQLNRMWYAGAYTAQMDMVPPGVASCFTQPVIFDGAKRDRAIWSGDLMVSDPVAMMSLGSNAAPYVTGSIDAFLNLQQTATGSVGRLHSAVGFQGCGGFNYAVTYSNYAAQIAIQYYRYTGDTVYITPLLSKLELATAYTATRLDANGLVVTNDNDYWQTSQRDEVTEYNISYYELLQDMIWLENRIGTPEKAAQYTADAAVLKNAINTRLFNTAAGLYQHTSTRPNVFPLDANMNAVKNGLAPADKVQYILDYFKAAWVDHGSQITQPSPSMTDPYGHTIEPLNNYWEMVARLRSNDAAGALELMRRLWGLQVDPTTPYYTNTFWEFVMANGFPDRGFDSLAHAWGAGPTQILTEAVIGATPVDPGYKTFQVKPQPVAIEWAQGQVPTAFGPLTVKWAQDAEAGKFHLEVVAPAGTGGEVWVPIVSSSAWTSVMSGSATFIRRSGLYDIYQVGSGTVEFRQSPAPVVTNSGNVSVQYSDAVPTTVSASSTNIWGSQLTAVASGLPAGLSLAAGATSNDGVLPGTRTWTVNGNVTAAPGVYPVTVTVTDEVGASAATSFTITVTQEDAGVAYTGDFIIFTAPGGNTANVLLRATVSDSSLIASFNDTAPGDIRNATVTFKEGTSVLCTANLPVALLGTDPTLGSASCTKSFGVGAHTISVYVGNYYVGTAEGLVEVASPDGSFISGGAWRTASASFGKYAATAGGREQFAFNVKYNKNNTNIQGHANVIFVSGGKTYQATSNSLDSLGTALKTPTGGVCTGVPSATCWGIASFRAKANLTDITNPAAPVSVASNLSLQMTLTDKGEPGSNDTIGVALYNGNTLLFASEWNGSKTVEGAISGGNLVVH